MSQKDDGLEAPQSLFGEHIGPRKMRITKDRVVVEKVHKHVLALKEAAAAPATGSNQSTAAVAVQSDQVRLVKQGDPSCIELTIQ